MMHHQKYCRVTDAMKSQIRRLRKQHFSYPQIAEITGVSQRIAWLAAKDVDLAVNGISQIERRDLTRVLGTKRRRLVMPGCDGPDFNPSL